MDKRDDDLETLTDRVEAEEMRCTGSQSKIKLSILMMSFDKITKSSLIKTTTDPHSRQTLGVVEKGRRASDASYGPRLVLRKADHTTHRDMLSGNQKISSSCFFLFSKFPPSSYSLFCLRQTVWLCLFFSA